MKLSERESLDAHVDLCGERYKTLFARMKRVEYWLAAITILLLVGEGSVIDVVKRLIGG